MATLRKKIRKTAKSAKQTLARPTPALRRPGPVDPAAGKTTVKIAAAKGRPMLTWVGKRPLGQLPAFPAQLVETFEAAPLADKAAWTDWPSKYPKGGLLFHGDNKEVLTHLLANGFRGKVQLIYIDPPFDSGADYVRKVSLRGPAGSTKVDGSPYTLGEQIQYSDIWANDNYLQFMYERVLLLRELLAETGSIYVHSDYRRSHHLHCILDEVFGSERLINEVVWHYSGAGVPEGSWASRHDTLLWFGRSDKWIFNADSVRTEYAETTKERFAHQIRNVRGGRDFGTQELNPLGKYPEDVLDISIEAPSATVRTGYPTQKPENLLLQLIEASSKPGDIVLDCFIGSGTTAAVAQTLGRRWIACDINKGAIQTTAKRVQEHMQSYAREIQEGQQASLIEKEGNSTPAQVAFSVWRVNDYDLQIQHNEAVNLACEHLGVQRIKSDRYFDGTLGKSLVKIVPFDHPLSPLDVEELKRELDARKEEDRPITFVCLGIENAAKPIIDDWNRLRKGKNAANRVDVIELRRDAKHGGWLNHMPAQAEVSITRKGKSVVVQIENFISPSIVERLRQQAGILEPKIEDFRAMIDSVAIDTHYDGKVFNVTLNDVPERKTDYVQARYELSPVGKPTTVAVRITDMLGEEVLVVKTV